MQSGGEFLPFQPLNPFQSFCGLTFLIWMTILTLSRLTSFSSLDLLQFAKLTRKRLPLLPLSKLNILNTVLLLTFWPQLCLFWLKHTSSEVCFGLQKYYARDCCRLLLSRADQFEFQRGYMECLGDTVSVLGPTLIWRFRKSHGRQPRSRRQIHQCRSMTAFVGDRTSPGNKCKY